MLSLVEKGSFYAVSSPIKMWLWELQGAFQQFVFCMRRRRQSPPAQTETGERRLHRVALLLAAPLSGTGFRQGLPHHAVARVS